MQNENSIEQYLTFVIDDEEYAIAILRVKEIIAYDTVTRVPCTAAFIRGMINLRGSVVPVIDVAVKFGLRPAEITPSSCIIIVEVGVDADSFVVGLLVDAVSQVIDMTAADIEAPPHFGTIRSGFLRGMAQARNEKKFVLLLDLDRVMSSDDIVAIDSVAFTDEALATEPISETVAS